MNQNSKKILILLLFFFIDSFCTNAQNLDQLLKAAGTPVNPKVPIAWNRYYDTEGLDFLSQKITNAYPHIAKMQVIGKSMGGRNIWALIITDFEHGEPENKPAIYIEGNIHGNELQGGEYSLYLAWYLTENSADNKCIQDLLAHNAFYIVPTTNPDARDYFIHTPTTKDDPRGYDLSQYKPRHRDLDGDGNISMMRWKDSLGIWRKNADNPNLMTRLPDSLMATVEVSTNALKAGEYIAKKLDGANYSLAIEGDSLKLGMDIFQYYFRYGARAGTDFFGIGGTKLEYYDPNRNWGWEVASKDSDGSIGQPFSFPETRCIRDFFLLHPNISLAVDFHNNAGAIYTGSVKKSWEKNSESDDKADVSLYNKLGEYGRLLLPGYKYVAPVNGGLNRGVDWMYGRRGVYAFIVELMSHAQLQIPRIDTSNSKDAIDIENELNREYDWFNKELLFNDAFIPWHKLNYSPLGEVEIGGLKKTFPRLTPGFMMEAEAHRNMAFCLFLASHLPALEIKKITVRDKNRRLHLKEVTAVIANNGLLPTHSAPDVKYNINRPDYISLATSGKVISVAQVTSANDAHVEIIKEQKQEPERFELNTIPGNTVIAIKWIVKGGDKFTVNINSVKGCLISSSVSSQ